MDVYKSLYQRIKVHCPNTTLLQQEPMANHTTFRVGGAVRLMACPSCKEEAHIALREAVALGITPFFLGKGSNLLVADDGWDGFVINMLDGPSAVTVQGTVLEAQAGIRLSKLAEVALEHGLTGLEFAHGIPGTLGGATTMNAGAYGGEMRQVITAVSCAIGDGVVETIGREDCDFGYRHSVFSGAQRLILSVKLELSEGNKEDIKARMDELALQRRSKQPLEYPSGGSTFKRPEGQFAAALIQDCGLKGYTIGGAQVSEKHSGFVVNRGGATCSDICALIDHIRNTVYEKTGTMLETEIKTLGL